MISETGASSSASFDVELSDPGSGALSGTGGNDIGYLRINDKYVRTNIISTGAVAYNESQYEMASDVCPIGSEYHYEVSQHLTSNERPDGNELEGEGGDDAGIFTGVDQYELQDILMNGAIWVNESSYPTPVSFNPFAVINNSSNNIDLTGLGYTFRVNVFDTNDNPVSGTLTLYLGGFNVIDSVDVEGAAAINIPPEGGLYDGENVSEQTTFNMLFESEGVVPFVKEDIPPGTSVVLNYTNVDFNVTDVDGNPVNSDAVAVEGKTAYTDPNGNATLTMPASGDDFEVLAMGGNFSLPIDPATQDTVSLQYGGIDVSVTNPDTGSGIVGVPVEIGGNNYTTNERGRVELAQVPPGTYEVTLFDKYTTQIEVREQGSQAALKFGETVSPGFDINVDIGSISVSAKDRISRDAVRNTTAFVRETGVESTTGPQGNTEVLHTISSSTATVVIGRGDKRYKTETVTVDLTVSEPEVSVLLEPRTPTVNF